MARAGGAMASGSANATRPLAVTDLDRAAELLKVTREEVDQVAHLVTPWPGLDGTTWWSLDQLHRHLTGQGKVKAKGRPPVLNLEDAEAAAIMAETATLVATATAYGTTIPPLRRAWRIYGIADPTT
jgi:hypothetical protein